MQDNDDNTQSELTRDSDESKEESRSGDEGEEAVVLIALRPKTAHQKVIHALLAA
ncbi:hypothetical protein DPMN_096459 [Dreissena polymorpha]|uniref:Uncharacterized protein n=1 Tax=Dreissena polymorpha TaxID=45954 RepID=A0A9D4R3P0_DREPO|nr:hypothetical protein DPMN_096459 [Dreissena polymorpha]